jgi:hypothetical protein
VPFISEQTAKELADLGYLQDGEIEDTEPTGSTPAGASAAIDTNEFPDRASVARAYNTEGDPVKKAHLIQAWADWGKTKPNVAEPAPEPTIQELHEQAAQLEAAGNWQAALSVKSQIVNRVGVQNQGSV